MRLDLFLKASRIVPRRTLAQKFCDANQVKVNGGTAKSSREIRAGDEIEIKKGTRRTTVKVLEVPVQKQVSREKAASLYEVTGEETLGDGIFD